MIKCLKFVFRRVKTDLQTKFLVFNSSEKIEAFLELLLACQVPMETDRFCDGERWWWTMIECSKPVFRQMETGLQAKFLAFSSSEEVETLSELLLTCQIPIETDRFNDDEQWWWTMMINNDDEWWLNVWNLYSVEQKWVYRPNFWLSIPQRGWRHFQNCCWPVRPQWRLTGLMVNEMMRKWWWWRVRHMKFVCLICPQTKQLMCYAVYEVIQLHL